MIMINNFVTCSIVALKNEEISAEYAMVLQ